MPIDVQLTYTDGSTEMYNIPLRIMRGEKTEGNIKVVEDWPWTNPEYTLMLDRSKSDIQSIEIDPTKRLADIDGQNNSLKVN